MKTTPSLLYAAWKKLILAYGLAFVVSLATGTLLVKVGNIQAHALYEISTKRISYALPVLEKGVEKGVDLGLLLFIWNSIGALATMSFIYTASWFNPHQCGLPPRSVRQFFCAQTRMKLFCYLPGCAQFEAEPLRRLHVWLMVPMLGIFLLGVESGLSVATAAHIFGSFFSSIIALLPHGVIEIPTLALAGAVTYSAHLLISNPAPSQLTRTVFQRVETHRRIIPIKIIAGLVIGGLFLAGWVEAHVTRRLLDNLLV